MNSTTYAITLTLDVEKLKEEYPYEEWREAFNDVRDFMIENGFKPHQKTLYFGDKDSVNAVKCTTTIQALSKKFDWFKECVRHVRMLRIAESSNLYSAL